MSSPRAREGSPRRLPTHLRSGPFGCRGADQPFELETMTVGGISTVAAERDRHPLRHPCQQPNALARIGVLHLATITARIGGPDLGIVHVPLQRPSEQLPAGR